VDIIIRPDKEPGRLLPNHTGPSDRFDPNVAQDRTGIAMSARPRKGHKSGDPYTDASVLMTKPQFHKCPECGNHEFRIVADGAADAVSGLIQIICGRCKTLWPILELHVPQVNDLLMRRLGLAIPTPGLAMSTMLDDDDE
jgi:hypothetical protein